jgi:hypothetical protein
MLKFINCGLFIFLIFSNCALQAFSGEQEKERLEKIGNAYQAFLNFAGNEAIDCASIEAEASLLFAVSFKKVVNNRTALEGRTKLGSYLWKFRENLGRWKINPNAYSLIPSTDDFSYITVTYTVETIDMAKPIRLIVIAILKVDEDEKIIEIFEVDNSIETTDS